MGRKKQFNDHPFPYHHELELTVESLTNLGSGVARVPLGGPEERWVIFVPFALPGERVRARIFRNHKNYSEADLIEVLEPSPHRVQPKCPLFGSCGGCQYQNLAYPEQLKWKQQQVAELLQHMARIETKVNPVIRSPREFSYRSKLTPHFQRQNDPDTPMTIGFLRVTSRFAMVDVPHCPIATDAINERLSTLREEVKARRPEYKHGATLLLREAREGVVTEPGVEVTEEVEGVTLRFLARDFFQNNPFILPAFTSYVREEAAASGARFLVDTYCGSGLFALTAARAFEAVAGVEVSETAVDRARSNAAANGIGNARFLAGDAGAIFSGLDFPAAQTAVVIDPPRKGCDPGFLQQLIAFGPATVVYVSCDPATQMRDLSVLVPGGYRLTAVQPFDLFPQTRHLECVITLRRAG